MSLKTKNKILIFLSELEDTFSCDELKKMDSGDYLNLLEYEIGSRKDLDLGFSTTIKRDFFCSNDGKQVFEFFGELDGEDFYEKYKQVKEIVSLHIENIRHSINEKITLVKHFQILDSAIFEEEIHTVKESDENILNNIIDSIKKITKTIKEDYSIPTFIKKEKLTKNGKLEKTYIDNLAIPSDIEDFGFFDKCNIKYVDGSVTIFDNKMKDLSKLPEIKGNLYLVSCKNIIDLSTINNAIGGEVICINCANLTRLGKIGSFLKNGVKVISCTLFEDDETSNKKIEGEIKIF